MNNLIIYAEYGVYGVLLLASMVAFAIAMERILIYWKVGQGERGRAVLEELIDQLREGDINALRRVLSREPRSGYERILERSVSLARRESTESIQEALEGERIREEITLGRGILFLSTLGNNAPFIGLLGTVFGVVRAFQELSLSGGGGSAPVMASLSGALYATAAGLMVALPAVALNNYLTSRKRQILERFELIQKGILALRMELGRETMISLNSFAGKIAELEPSHSVKLTSELEEA